jgi:hypothetical protein
MVLDLPGNEDDPLAQQAGLDVEAALTVGLLDNDGNQRGHGIEIIVHDALSVLLCLTLHRAKSKQVQGGLPLRHPNADPLTAI